MEQTKLDFIYLLSCFLNGKNPENRNYDWERLYKLADINDVACIIAFLIKSLDSGNKPVGETMMYFKKSMAVAISSYEEKSAAYKIITEIFNDNGIAFIALKGIILREFYPVKEFRTSGDIDFTVKKEHFSKVRQALEDNNIKILSDNAGVITAKTANCLVEIHNSADVKSSYFNDIFSTERNGNALCDYDHLLYVLCHLLKHLSYRGAGIRMLMDIDVMIRAIKNFDEDRFYESCKKAGVEKGAKVMLSLASLWFDTPVKTFYKFTFDNELVIKLASVLIDGGSFGYETSFVPASYVKNRASNGGELTLSSRLGIALKMAFPEKDYLKKCYKYYEEHSILYPVAVINRLYDGVFKKRSNSKGALKQIFSDDKTALIQQELLSELEIMD